ncbi:hypothetical protein PIGHUM_01776 [Pigmentiphaga humi]|uniref:Glycine zipper domain-containing protein n=1 Tax=Pigmentiphaga humi TaxID=2478468 RepID=A0A3P4B089_9BURK|nr:hypothetical protein [Pigmentiphaga humi]VCU69713.1 hypothetical protein PIGHUM_01776 [Pigmentiphaga humi]
MSLIVAARFDTFDRAGQAADRLMRQGFLETDLDTFYVGPAGQHDRYPIGGDQPTDPDAKSGASGAVAGSALFGLVFALVGGWIAGQFGPGLYLVLLGAAVGAYIGAFIGALSLIGRRHQRRTGPGWQDNPEQRRAGVMLAVRVQPGQEEPARRILQETGGMSLERANGRWVDGKWEDFDPLAPPHRIAEASPAVGKT